MKNASGIGNLDQLRPSDILRLLRHAADHPGYAPLLEALARPGKPGTLGTRMLGTPAEDLLRAKTGTGDDAVALSGIVGQGRGALRFSAIIDDHASRTGARRGGRRRNRAQRDRRAPETADPASGLSGPSEEHGFRA